MAGEKKEADEDICLHCGEERGDHRKRDLACPVILEKRGTYSNDLTFEKREDLG